MPFTSKYTNLGKTERIRIPAKYLSHIRNILEEYDRLCGTKGENLVYKIIEKYHEGLHNI
jgi:hypothetical protein